MRDYESVWSGLEAWRERMAGDVALESVGAGWLCRLQAPLRGIAPILCHGADATTAVEGALAALSARERSASSRALAAAGDPPPSQVVPRSVTTLDTLSAKAR